MGGGEERGAGSQKEPLCVVQKKQITICLIIAERGNSGNYVPLHSSDESDTTQLLEFSGENEKFWIVMEASKGAINPVYKVPIFIIQITVPPNMNHAARVSGGRISAVPNVLYFTTPLICAEENSYF